MALQSWLGDGFHRARKKHVCDTCGHHIVEGHVYAYQAFMADGDFCYFKQHLLCAAVAEELWQVIDANDYDNGLGDIKYAASCLFKEGVIHQSFFQFINELFDNDCEHQSIGTSEATSSQGRANADRG